MPLGTPVLARGIVFIDLAIAQVAACGVLLVSVQLVGLYLVFATLIVPPLATRRMTRGRLPAAWVLGALGYAVGLVVSAGVDLPSGPTIVWVLTALALGCYALTPGTARDRSVPERVHQAVTRACVTSPNRRSDSTTHSPEKGLRHAVWEQKSPRGNPKRDGYRMLQTDKAGSC